ncbi:MAG: hypothetical protein M0Z61_16975 [Nitrospiraceae bacterium]|nr:hypothetical protein [Nitrospiraceae bacterium]
MDSAKPMTTSQIRQLLAAVSSFCDDGRLKGVIRPTSRFARCKCGQHFKHIFKIGYFCPDCGCFPMRYYIDLHWHGERHSICSDRQRKPFNEYGAAHNLLCSIQGEIDNGTFDPTKYVHSKTKKFFASTLLDQFLKKKLTAIAPSYRSGYKKQVFRAKQFFGNMDVREIRKKDIIQYLDFLKMLEK